MELIYLDNCCFNRPFDDQSQARVFRETEAKLFVQDLIRSGRVDLTWSYMMDYENDANPFEERRVSISPWRKLAKVDVGVSALIVERAKELNGLGFGKKDSLHLSCALAADCDLFLTTDKGILKKRDLVGNLAIINPVDYHLRDDD